MEKISGLIICGCWIFFLVYWFIAALRAKPIAERQSIASALAHRIPVGFGAYLLAYRHFPPPWNHLLTPRTDLTMGLGGAICLAGLFITIWARRTLAGNWGSDVSFKRDHELVQAGPYRFARHPIYTGLLVMFIGTALFAGPLHCWLAVPVEAFGFWIKLSHEERLLLRYFPNSYPAYRKNVKALVPFVF